MSNKDYIIEKLEKHRAELLARKSYAILKDIFEDESIELDTGKNPANAVLKKDATVIDGKEVKVAKPDVSKSKDIKEDDGDPRGPNGNEDKEALKFEAAETNPEIEKVKKDIAAHQEHMSNSEQSNDSYHISGEHDKDASTMFGLKKRLADLQKTDKQTKEQDKAVKEELTEAKKPKKKKGKKPLFKLYKGPSEVPKKPARHKKGK